MGSRLRATPGPCRSGLLTAQHSALLSGLSPSCTPQAGQGQGLLHPQHVQMPSHRAADLLPRRGTATTPTALCSAMQPLQGTHCPPVVLHRELEVGERDGDEGGHNDQDHKHDEQDAVDRVHLQGASRG